MGSACACGCTYISITTLLHAIVCGTLDALVLFATCRRAQLLAGFSRCCLLQLYLPCLLPKICVVGTHRRCVRTLVPHFGSICWAAPSRSMCFVSSNQLRVRSQGLLALLARQDLVRGRIDIDLGTP
jgi:hypothetical protein